MKRRHLGGTVCVIGKEGIMGEGCIPVREISKWVDEAGFTGYREVEIFSEIYWKEDQDQFLEKTSHSQLNPLCLLCV